MRKIPFDKRWVAVASAAFLFGCGGSDGDVASGPPNDPVDEPPAQVVADSVFTNGNVLTVDANFSTAQAFAVKDGKFLAIGSNADIQQYIGEGTAQNDLNGQTVIPGLNDNHFHNYGGGTGIDLNAEKVHNLQELFDAVGEYARTAAPGQDPNFPCMIRSNSDWHEGQLTEQRTPLAQELEAAAPGCVTLVYRGGHSVFLSTTALAYYGIDENAPTLLDASQGGGGVPKQADGSPTGEVIDGARGMFINTNNGKFTPQTPPLPGNPDAEQIVLDEQKIINSYGLTSVRHPGTSAAAFARLKKLASEGKSTVRYSVAISGGGNPANTLAGMQSAGYLTLEQDRQTKDPWVRSWGIKYVMDGGFETGFMTQPYENPPGSPDPNYRGAGNIAQGDFNTRVAFWNDNGFRVTTHAVGDAAIDMVLQAYEKANATKDLRDAGFAIEHAFIIRNDGSQLPRLKYLNIRMSVQDHLYQAAATMQRYLGWGRASTMTPAKTYLEAGLQTSAGTDSAVIPMNPFWVMYHFITRDTIADGRYGESVGVSREEGLRMSTIYGAALDDAEDYRGSIETGKVADFVVLSDNFMTVADEGLRNMTARQTWVDGKKVYDAQTDGTPAEIKARIQNPPAP
jgi:predicted amidohydrolase YtcJ